MIQIARRLTSALMVLSQTGNAGQNSTLPLTPPQPQFESENVTRNNSGAAGRTEQFDGRQFTIRNITLNELLPFAFLRKESEIAGIPAWFKSERYDVIAKAPSDNTTEETLA